MMLQGSITSNSGLRLGSGSRFLARRRASGGRPARRQQTPSRPPHVGLAMADTGHRNLNSQVLQSHTWWWHDVQLACCCPSAPVAALISAGGLLLPGLPGHGLQAFGRHRPFRLAVSSFGLGFRFEGSEAKSFADAAEDPLTCHSCSARQAKGAGKAGHGGGTCAMPGASRSCGQPLGHFRVPLPGAGWVGGILHCSRSSVLGPHCLGEPGLRHHSLSPECSLPNLARSKHMSSCFVMMCLRPWSQLWSR